MGISKEQFQTALQAEGVSGKLADLSKSIFHQESGSGKNSKTSNAGAVGGMQIIQGTFDRVADKGWNINDPIQNARAGIRELVRLDRLSGGNDALTAAGYYGGEGGMNKARKGVAVSDPRNPNAPTTLQYAQQVVNRMGGGRGELPRQSEPTTLVAKATAPAVMQEAAPAQEPIPEAVVAQAPVLAAPEQAPQVVQAPQGPDPWQAFQQAMQAEQLRATDLAYGAEPQGLAQLQIPAPSFGVGAPPRTLRPDFRAFGAWGGRQA